MQEAEALRIMSALAQSTRLRIIVLLIPAGDAGLTSSNIADAVDVPRNLMSAHLAILSKAGVVASRKSGRNVTYVARRSMLADLGGHLNDLAATLDQRVSQDSGTKH